MARIIPAGQAIEDAAQLLLAGELVAVPTETVYGLAADATQGDAVARIYAAKGRPSFNPLIAHVASMEMAERLGIFDPLSRRLAERFWPGPLTLVVSARPDSPVHPLVMAGLDTIAIRMPRGVARDVSARIDRPLAAPSANLSGKLTATSAAAVNAHLGDRIALIVDGGPTEVGLESTIVRVEDGKLRLLRPGGVTADALAEAAGVPVERNAPGAAIVAPGMLASHYAPRARMRLDVEEVREGEALLAFGPKRARGTELALSIRNLSASGDLAEAAANLFSYLAELDRSGASTVAVEPIPHTGLGLAINDRLVRAAAPRS